LPTPWPAFQKFGFQFIWRVEWDIINEEFGAAIAIVGTLASATIALLIAVPLAFGIALFLTENCPVAAPPAGHGHRVAGRRAVHHLRHVRPVCVCAVVCRLRADRLQSTLGRHAADRACLAAATNGIGILAAGIVLAFMVLALHVPR
jgi:phosphate transport system permease protein